MKRKWTLKIYFLKMEAVIGKNLLNAGIIEPVADQGKNENTGNGKKDEKQQNGKIDILPMM